MGKKRFEKMLTMLPAEKEVLGIDEHTAAVVDLKTKEMLSMGNGKLWQIENSKPVSLGV